MTSPIIEVSSPRLIFSTFAAQKHTGSKGFTGAVVLPLISGEMVLRLTIVAVYLRWAFGTVGLRLAKVIRGSKEG
jgi:hypothetical protein